MTRDFSLENQIQAYCERARRRPRATHSIAEALAYAASAGGLAFSGGDALGAVVHNATGAQFTAVDSSATFSANLDGAGGPDWGGFLSGAPVTAIAFGGVGTVATSSAFFARAINLSPGFVVGPTLASGVFNTLLDYWYYHSEISAGPFYNHTTGYLGVRFLGDTGNLGTQYAWLKVRFDWTSATRTLQMNVLEWAYDTCGDPIAVGATSGGSPCSVVPSPSSPLLVLLGLGALGVQTYRRRLHAGAEALTEGDIEL